MRRLLCIVACLWAVAGLEVDAWAAVIAKGAVSHPGGNTCTVGTAATFVADGKDIVLIYEDQLPFSGMHIYLDPASPVTSGFSYTPSAALAVTVLTYGELTPGQPYSFKVDVCGPPADLDLYTILGDGCSAIATTPPVQSTACSWDNGLLQPLLRFDTKPILLGQSAQGTLTLWNTDSQPLSATLGISCPEFSIVGNPAVSIPPGLSATVTIRYDPTIDDTVVGRLTPSCAGSLVLGSGIGPRILVGTSTAAMRRRLDGSLDAFMDAGADHIDFGLDVAKSDVYMARWSANHTNDGIYKGTFDGGFTRIVSVDKPYCVEFDPVANKVYWGAGGMIRRANPNGTSIESLPVPITFSTGPVDLAIDPQTRELYWAEGATSSIKRATVDGASAVTLASGTGGGDTRLALDHTAGRLYWTETTPARIRRMLIDGTNQQTLLAPGLIVPASVAIDAVTGQLYWTDQGTNSVHRVDADGENPTEIATGLTAPTGIFLVRPVVAVTERMFWLDNTSDWLRSAGKDGSDPQSLVNTGLSEPRGMALDGNAGKLYWVDQGNDRIRRVKLDGSGIQDLVTSGLDAPEDIALDLEKGKMYWTDSGATDRIQRANLDGSGVETLPSSGLFGVRGIALDLVHRQMYWTQVEAGHTGIFRSAMTPNAAPELLWNSPTTPPSDIDLDVAGGKMYFVVNGVAQAAVRRANLDGTAEQSLYQSSVAVGGTFRAIALDLRERKVYWTSANEIRCGNLDGSAQLELQTGLASAQGIAVAVPAGFPETSDAEPGPVHVPRIRLDAPLPNPFNPSTRISYGHAGGELEICIYDVRGRCVRRLLRGVFAAGDGTITWDGRDDLGQASPSGLYVIRMRSARDERSVKAVLVR